MRPLILESFPPIPEDTRAAALSVFDKNNFYICIGDQLDKLFVGITLVDPDPGKKTPARTLAMFNLTTIFQFLETLPDRRLSDSLRKRVDWKYALHLPLQRSGFEASGVHAFRISLCADQEGQKCMQKILVPISGILAETKKQELPHETATILKKVCTLSRVAEVWDAMSETLGALAMQEPVWLSCVTKPEWYMRYSQRQKSIILASANSEQEAFAAEIGADGFYLLNAIEESRSQRLADIPKVITLREIWSEQYDQKGGQINMNNEDCIDCLSVADFANPLETPDTRKEEGYLN